MKQREKECGSVAEWSEAPVSVEAWAQIPPLPLSTHAHALALPSERFVKIFTV